MQSTAKENETKQIKESKAMQSKAEQSKAMQRKAERLHLTLPELLPLAGRNPLYWGRAGFNVLKTQRNKAPESSFVPRVDFEVIAASYSDEYMITEFVDQLMHSCTKAEDTQAVLWTPRDTQGSPGRS